MVRKPGNFGGTVFIKRTYNKATGQPCFKVYDPAQGVGPLGRQVDQEPIAPGEADDAALARLRTRHPGITEVL